MRKKVILPILIIGGIVVFALAILPLSASAIARDDQQDTSQDTDSDKPRLLQDTGERKLKDQKLKACQKRSVAINTIMRRSVARVEKHKQVFDTISERVQNLYEKKGKAVANYDSLLADVNNAKMQVEADISAMKAYEKFSCDTDDPKGQAQTFKENLSAARDNLKTYRQAIKDLIVGVRSANTEGEE
jgi:hypothetical protein